MFVYKFSVQGNLYLVRYKQLKFRFQGKFCGKITTTNGSNCNRSLRKHSLWYANLTVCDLKFRLQNYHKSHTLCLVCLIRASLNGISQVTFLLLDTIVFRRYRLFVPKWSNVSFVTWHWNTSHCLELSNTTSSYWSSNSQSCPLQNTTSVHKYLWKLHFIIRSHGSFLFRRITLNCLQRQSNKSVSAALHDISCQGKVSLFMLALLIGFAGKYTLYKGRKTLYKAKFWYLPLEIRIAGL